MSNNDKVEISPKTKVGAMLDSFPQLENILIEIAPAFKKLQNPVLRKTIARVTSLAQAAKVANISLSELINKLRKEVGQDLSDITSSVSENDQGIGPEWAADDNIATVIDARPMLESGEQPLGPVMSALGDLDDDEVLKLITPFLPAPIIDLSSSKGYESWSKTIRDGEVYTLFRKQR